MVSMLLKMSGITLVYILLTILLYGRLRGKKLTAGLKIFIGLIYAGMSILSTHFGIDYIHMLLNVRDLGPLIAGLFFHPLSGVIAGLIGGVERYIAGTYWGIGSYTRIACSISTCLAGLLPIVMHYLVLGRKKPSTPYAFSLGAVMEVFHMYVVFITHRDDMKMAYFVVKTCAPPMIVFSAIGLAGCSIALRVMSGEWVNPFRRLRKADVPIASRFGFWLFVVTIILFEINILVAYGIQTSVALQNARETLQNVSGDIRNTYTNIRSTEKGLDSFFESTVLADAQSIALTIEHEGGAESIDDDFLKSVLEIHHLEAVCLLDADGEIVYASGSTLKNYTARLKALNDSAAKLVNGWFVAAVPLGEGKLCAALDPEDLQMSMSLAALNDALSYFHVGTEGTFDIIRKSGFVELGSHRNVSMNTEDLTVLRSLPTNVIFIKTLFGVESMCRTEELPDGLTLLVMLPLTEVYENRNSQTYENAFSDILLFTVIYMLITLLVQNIVVRNLDRVNSSLGRITQGDLNEVVAVRNSSEFASLSDDINRTVDVLKGYIDAAKKRIEKELEFAKAIQDAVLPKNFKFKRNDFELFATMDPAKEVGGDFYDFFFIQQNIMALVIADVSGKGIPAALFMMRAKTTIRSLAVSGDSPEQIFYKANNTLCEGNDAEMFVTAWIGIVDLTTGLMRCANAGHEYPVLMKKGGDFELFKDRHGLALAAMEDMPFKSYEIQLNPGDRLFVYTDGIPEAIDTTETQYGTDRLVDKLNALKELKMAEILPIVREDISAFAGEAEQFDDITMLGFTWYGSDQGRDSDENQNA